MAQHPLVVVGSSQEERTEEKTKSHRVVVIIIRAIGVCSCFALISIEPEAFSGLCFHDILIRPTHL